MLKKRQKEVLDFINKYLSKKGYSPSLEEIQRYFKLASVSTAHFHVKNLKNSGYLTKEENQPRSISTFQESEMVQIPLLGIVSAGKPIEAIENKETIAVPKEKLHGAKNVFGLKVSGNSMIDENIDDGDMVLLKEQPVPNNGDRVVALINSDEATLKTFYKEKNRIRLQPANKNMAPIFVKKNDQINIQGVLIDVVKNNPNQIISVETERIENRKSHGKLPLNKIICGDAIEGLKKLPSESCDIIIIDPPYNIGKDFGNNIDKREMSEYVRWGKSWINEAIRIMKPTGTMFIYGFSEILAFLSVEITTNKRWLIWHYTNKNVAFLNFWQRSYDAIICAWKGRPIFNRDEVREPYTEGFLNGAAGKIRKGTPGRFSREGKETIYKAHEKGALPRDVIKVPALAGGAGMVERWFFCKTCNNVFEPQKLKEHLKHKIIKHPTQKPLELTRRLIKSAMPKKNGVILIPFVGSGSECVVAKELGLNYVGFELNPDYIKIANKWIANTNRAL